MCVSDSLYMYGVDIHTEINYLFIPLSVSLSSSLNFVVSLILNL